ncbi:GNAT family N-acetyltransferase [Symbiopectobacterium sp. RP]|uniref:GNAT family N-acetyltransferase n=1 Tax=Symbiopectobacterium sp. RP TaxID=3248553 RepID=UPI003D29876C
MITANALIFAKKIQLIVIKIISLGYMFVGPFRDKDEYRAYLTTVEQQQDTQCYVVIDTRTDNAVGTFSLMRVDVNNGVIEVGSVAFSSALKRTPLATEAHFLLMGYVFEQLHYRRYEWKCDSLNAPSHRSAFGFYSQPT